jgi:hypothetical protein
VSLVRGHLLESIPVSASELLVGGHDREERRFLDRPIVFHKLVKSRKDVLSMWELPVSMASDSFLQCGARVGRRHPYQLSGHEPSQLGVPVNR